MLPQTARYELLEEEDRGPFTLTEFLAVNEGLDPRDVQGLHALRPGDVYRGGGGAGAEWGVRRLGGSGGDRRGNPRAHEADTMCLCGHPFGLHDNEMGEIPTSQAPCTRCRCPGAIRRFRRGNPRGAESTDQYLASLAAARQAMERKRVEREQILLAREERAQQRERQRPVGRPRGGIPTWAIMEREGNPMARRPNPSFQATAPITRGGTRGERAARSNPVQMPGWQKSGHGYQNFVLPSGHVVTVRRVSKRMGGLVGWWTYYLEAPGQRSDAPPLLFGVVEKKKDALAASVAYLKRRPNPSRGAMPNNPTSVELLVDDIGSWSDDFINGGGNGNDSRWLCDIAKDAGPDVAQGFAELRACASDPEKCDVDDQWVFREMTEQVRNASMGQILGYMAARNREIEAPYEPAEAAPRRPRGSDLFCGTADLVCPQCGHDDVTSWAEDGESPEADWAECAKCKFTARPDDPRWQRARRGNPSGRGTKAKLTAAFGPDDLGMWTVADNGQEAIQIYREDDPSGGKTYSVVHTIHDPSGRSGTDTGEGILFEEKPEFIDEVIARAQAEVEKRGLTRRENPRRPGPAHVDVAVFRPTSDSDYWVVMESVYAGKRDVAASVPTEEDSETFSDLQEAVAAAKSTAEKWSATATCVLATDENGMEIFRSDKRRTAKRRGNPTDPNAQWRAQQATAVWQTILSQMGGTSRLGAMVGARNFVALGNGVQFSIGSGAKNRINKVVITLEPDDTYTVQFWQIRGNLTKMVSEATDVYAEQLRPVFEDATGMYLSFARNPRENPVVTSNEPLSYGADLGEIEPLDPSRMAFERARQNLADLRAGQRLSQEELTDLVARGLIEASEVQAQPIGGSGVTARFLALHRPRVQLGDDGRWYVMVWSPTGKYIYQGSGHGSEHEARQELREWDREHTVMVSRVAAAERGEAEPVVRQVHRGGAAAASALPAPRALPPPEHIESDLIPLNDPAAKTFRAIIAAPVPDVVNPKERGLERKQIAKDIRQLLKTLKITGVGVTVPSYSMASSVHIRVPHVELTDQQRETPRDAAGNYQRSPVAQAAHLGRQASVAKLEKIILGAFPDLVDRSDSMTDYHDARLHFE